MFFCLRLQKNIIIIILLQFKILYGLSNSTKDPTFLSNFSALTIMRWCDNHVFIALLLADWPYFYFKTHPMIKQRSLFVCLFLFHWFVLGYRFSFFLFSGERSGWDGITDFIYYSFVESISNIIVRRFKINPNCDQVSIRFKIRFCYCFYQPRKGVEIRRKI